MSQAEAEQIRWGQTTVSSPHLPQPVPVIAAKSIPYFANANRLQNLNIYVPVTNSTSSLIGAAATSIPSQDPNDPIPRTLVHIHGGAWRDPHLTAASIEATVAHAFSQSTENMPVSTVVALNYSISPTQHPLFYPYDPIKDNHADPAREAVHPAHLRDILSGFSLLRSFGLTDGSYILSGHSAGACLGCQAILQRPSHYGIIELPSPPRPAAFLGCNGLYDLEQLVHGLGPTHRHTKDDYNTFLSIAFGEDQSKWPLASPARFDVDDIAQLVEWGEAPELVVFDESPEDQLVPMNQRERMVTQMEQVPGLRVVKGHRCSGQHSAPWQEGYMIWDNVLDVLQLLQEGRK